MKLKKIKRIFVIGLLTVITMATVSMNVNPATIYRDDWYTNYINNTTKTNAVVTVRRSG